ncbi:hypothetical protein [Methanosalsum natronophilum]|uniref:hypothetical protein n=1 Tax=Methanosalsum natronophilum TaxID=768733 RepID=UPI002168F1B2|nr:hypothetical protein [Methanosalsum natronophilum]MCS3924684.1 putative transcriptional regulator [Methanosalsum natronophilum]
MALEDIFGSTTVIKIFDFLAENIGSNYNQSEIARCAGVSRGMVNHKFPEMILNGLIEVKEEAGHMKTYQLQQNDLVKMLINASMINSFMYADIEDEDKELIDADLNVGSLSKEEEIRCYCGTSEQILEEPRYINEYKLNRHQIGTAISA